MIFLLGGIVILLVSFVIAFLSMLRERRRFVRQEQPVTVNPSGVSEKVPEAPATLQNMDNNSLPAEPARVDEKIELFPWLNKEQSATVVSASAEDSTGKTDAVPANPQILHPKHTTTIGSGLSNLNNSTVSIQDLKNRAEN